MTVRSKGVDSEGKEVFDNPEELWKNVDPDKQDRWYKPAVAYWDRQEPSVNGVLGGHADVSEVDLKASSRFLLKAFQKRLQEAAATGERLVALDCGAGVGRVSEGLLVHHFDVIDLVEPSQHLLAAARKCLQGCQKHGNRKEFGFFGVGLQDFTPSLSRYDVVWVQWALLYLTDADAIAFFQRCCVGLKAGGIIVVKENICKDGFIVDKDDSSLTRSNAYMLDLFQKAGLRLLYNVVQRNFPKDLLKVRTYALSPPA